MRFLAIVAFAVGLYCFGEAFAKFLSGDDRLAGLWAIVGCMNVAINLLCVRNYSK